jgi:hypothetical protein
VLAKGELEKALTADTQEKRLALCKANLSIDWRLAMFTDKKKFAFRYPGTKHKSQTWIKRSKGGEHGNKCFKPNNPQSANLYMGINKWCKSKVHKVTGSSGMQSKFINQKGKPSRNITSQEESTHM